MDPVYRACRLVHSIPFPLPSVTGVMSQQQQSSRTARVGEPRRRDVEQPATSQPSTDYLPQTIPPSPFLDRLNTDQLLAAQRFAAENPFTHLVAQSSSAHSYQYAGREGNTERLYGVFDELRRTRRLQDHERKLSSSKQQAPSSYEVIDLGDGSADTGDEVEYIGMDEVCMQGSIPFVPRRPPSPSTQPVARAWTKRPESRFRQPNDSGFKFTCVSYNVLCQKTIDSTQYLYRHLARSDRLHLIEWEARWRLIAKELETLDGDVVCLQEVQADHFYSHFQPFFDRRGLAGTFIKRTGNIKPDGCAIFYRHAAFECLQTVDVPYRTPGCVLEQFDNVGQIAILKPRGGRPDERVVVANTHLLFNPRRGDVKLAQLAVLLAHAERAAVKECQPFSTCFPGYHPVILGGDFNMHMGSPLYNFVVENNLPYHQFYTSQISGQGKTGQRAMPYDLLPDCLSDDCVLVEAMARRPWQRSAAVVRHSGAMTHPFSGMRSSYQQPRPRAVSTHQSADSALVDYIFHTSDLQVTETLSLPTIEELQATCGLLPNEHAGSDHLPLGVKFEMKLGGGGKL